MGFNENSQNINIFKYQQQSNNLYKPQNTIDHILSNISIYKIIYLKKIKSTQ